MITLDFNSVLRARRQAKKPPATTVQTLILSKTRFKTRQAAVKWVKDHDFHAKNVDETETSWRFRQREPGEFQSGSFRTITMTSGIKAVIGRLKRRSKRESVIRYRVDFVARQEEEQIVTGVVADPENVDSYGNKIPEEEIWKAAWKFMELYRNTGVGHERDAKGKPVILNDKIRILESWVTREKTKIGGQSVPAIAWILTVRILDPKIWKAVKRGKLTGFSLEAKTKRIPIAETKDGQKKAA